MTRAGRRATVRADAQPDTAALDSITLENFRCFRERQTARLAPLTLLVGDNSTGKTSFMAMIRALWDMAYGHRVPDFKEDPYDLGGFDDIAHHRGRRGGRAADRFEAGFEAGLRHRRATGAAAEGAGSHRFSVVFERGGTVPVPALRRLARGDLWIEDRRSRGAHREFRIGTRRGSWKSMNRYFDGGARESDRTEYAMQPFDSLFYKHIIPPYMGNEQLGFSPMDNSSPVTDKDLSRFEEIVDARFEKIADGDGDTLFESAFVHNPFAKRPYASAPVRSKPRRTYDPARAAPDPEGDYVPMYLANMSFQDRGGWEDLKEALEAFGRDSGLFDEIDVRRLGKGGSDPFQLRVRKFGKRLKGPPRNMTDVGYGVSQVLPVVAELLRRDAPSMFLLQQPEVHLHPSAQAGLGSLFCAIADPHRQLVVETHSDHLIDRVRMDARDGRGTLKPDDVSILFFERDELDVRIHSLRLDGEGNVLGTPEGYRAFFMEETRRSLGF